MLEPDIKKKIINTLSQYKKKCADLQGDVVHLKNALEQLTLLPMGIYVDLDSGINLLNSELKNNNASNLSEKVTVLINTLTKLIANQESNTAIDRAVNTSLNQLLEHLTIPKELELNLDVIKNALKISLDPKTLKKVINDISTLVLDVFSIEQKQLKVFVQQLSEQLNDFDTYLLDSSKHMDETTKESNALEQGIQYNIDQMKTHLDSSSSIKELSEKMKKNLSLIGTHIKVFRDSEAVRNKSHSEKVEALQQKLTQSHMRYEELSNKMLMQRAKMNYDGLTELPNRQAYDEHLLDACNRWKQERTNLSLAVGDIDHFKKINDTYGHLAGDKVLRKIAQLLKNFVRTTDFVARFGGEEFVIIFEKTSTFDAKKVLDKVRDLIQNCEFSYKDQVVNVTMSFGVTELLPEDSQETFFIRADEAMYAAKEAGRNCIMVF